MNEWIPEKDTGYLIPSNKPHTFTAERKKAFLSIYKETHHLGEACERVGISRGTYLAHKENDPKFRGELEELLEFTLDDCEKNVLEAGKKGNVVANLAYLRTYRPVWRQQTTVNHVSNEKQVKSLLEDWKKGAIEAELVDNDTSSPDIGEGND